MLSVLWLTAALSTIAIAVADSVRAEALRAISSGESLKAYYLARGAIEQQLFRFHDPGAWSSSIFEVLRNRRRLYLREREGDILVEFVSEHSKLAIRSLNPGVFRNLLVAFGEPVDRAQQLTERVFSAGAAPLSQFSFVQPTFRPSLASLENVEEFLNFPGMTQEIVYGRYRRLANGALVNAGGLADCLAQYGSPGGPFDAAGVHPALLMAYGVEPDLARQFAEIRRNLPEPGMIVQTPLGARMPVKEELSPVFTVRATARVRLPNGTLSETRRTVALKVLFVQPDFRFPGGDPWSYLRWYDQTDSEFAASDAPWATPPAGVSTAEVSRVNQ